MEALNQGAVRRGRITEEEKQRAANQSAAYVVGAQANAASNAARVAETQDAGGSAVNFAPMPAINSKSGITAQPPVLAPAPVAEPSQYRKEMGELGSFVAGAPVEAFKTLVSAPGYGFNAPDKPAMPQPATVPAAGAIPAAVPSPAPQAQQRMTSTFGATDPRRQDVQAPLSAYGATNVGDGITKMAIPGKTPLYTNMTDAAGMASNEALVGRGAITAQNQGAAEALASRYGVDPALTAARDAAIARGDIDAVRASYGGNFMGKTAADAPIDALMNNGRPMTAKKAGAIAQLQAQRDGNIQAGATRKLAEDKFALEATGTKLDNAGKKQLQEAQTKLANAKTAAERLSATDTLRALQGKFEKEMPNRFTVVPGGQAVDPATQQLVREPSQVLDNQTGQFINAAPPKPAQNFTKGQTYTDARGNKAVWDGQQFVAAK